MMSAAESVGATFNTWKPESRQMIAQTANTNVLSVLEGSFERCAPSANPSASFKD